MNHLEQRARMVEVQLVGRGIANKRVLDAFRAVPREAFLPADAEDRAYHDAPVPIGSGQTMSQPYIVAVMSVAMALHEQDRVLEIGTGSGYAAAIFSLLAKDVYTVERLAPLAEAARTRLDELGYHNVHVRCADGTLGWPEQAPFDAIAVAAGGPEVPHALREQLAVGGRLVMPVGRDESKQVLTRVTRAQDLTLHAQPLLSVRFVPLIGEQGWPENVHGQHALLGDDQDRSH